MLCNWTMCLTHHSKCPSNKYTKWFSAIQGRLLLTRWNAYQVQKSNTLMLYAQPIHKEVIKAKDSSRHSLGHA